MIRPVETRSEVRMRRRKKMQYPGISSRNLDPVSFLSKRMKHPTKKMRKKLSLVMTRCNTKEAILSLETHKAKM